MSRFVLFAAFVMTTVACAGHAASSGAAPKQFNPVGVYEYTSAANGQTITGTITVAGSPGAYRAVMTTGVTRDLTFPTVQVNGNHVHMEMPGSASPTTVDLTVTGAAVTGKWAMGAMAGEIRGTRRGS